LVDATLAASPNAGEMRDRSRWPLTIKDGGLPKVAVVCGGLRSCWANFITVLQEVAITRAAREKACELPSELSYFGEFGPSQWSWDTLTATLQWRCRPWVGAIKAALQLPPDVGIVDALATACKQMGFTCQRAATRCQPSPTASWK
jgi:hypothetical protein